MTDTNNTDGAALLPVTQADRELAIALFEAGLLKSPLGASAPDDMVIARWRKGILGEGDNALQVIARHRISHSLPGDVGTALRAESIMNAVLDLPFANTAPIEWDDADWHQVRRAIAALTPSPLPATQEDAERSGDVRVAISEAIDEFKPGMPHSEKIDLVWCAISALSTRQRQEYDGEAVRGAAEHYTVAMDRRPKEIGGVKVGPGLYRIHWKDGGSSLAAIGMCRNGAWWVAPTNWTEPAVAFRIDEDPEGRWSWADVKALDRLDPAALAPSAVSGDAGEGSRLRSALAKRTSMSTVAGGGRRPQVEIRFADLADAHALADAILNRSDKEDDHGPRP